MFDAANLYKKLNKSIKKVIPHRSKPVFITVVMNVRNGRYEHRFRPMQDDLMAEIARLNGIGGITMEYLALGKPIKNAEFSIL